MSANKATILGERSFRRDDTGATAIEYGLIAMLVSVGLIGALWTYSEAVGDVYEADTAAINAVIAQE